MYIISEGHFYINRNKILEQKVLKDSTRKHGFTKKKKRKRKK